MVRPPSPPVNAGAIEAVRQAVKADPNARCLVLASFNAGQGASSALSAWTKAGLVDPAAGSGRRAGQNAATYPASRPTQRADLIVVSATLKFQAGSYRAWRQGRSAEVSDHLPVVLVLRP